MTNAEILRTMTDADLSAWLRRHIARNLLPEVIPPEELQRIREMDDVRLASYISAGNHAADYEEDDYDPKIFKWLTFTPRQVHCFLCGHPDRTLYKHGKLYICGKCKGGIAGG